MEIEDSALPNQGKVYPVSPHPRKKWQVTWEDTLEEEVIRIEESQNPTAGKHIVTRREGGVVDSPVHQLFISDRATKHKKLLS